MKVTHILRSFVNKGDNGLLCDIDDWNLSDDFLSEGAEARIPNSIKNINKNMDGSLLSKKSNARTGFAENKEQDNDITDKRIDEDYLNLIDVGPLDRKNKIRTCSDKRSLKDDISMLLRMVAKNNNSSWRENKPKYNSLLIKDKFKVMLNSEQKPQEIQYVTMKEIQQVSEFNHDC